ncbi:hypothetical protein F4860DRAFT_242361 [Xylaria cubensis]|nr:hypothetical protein F4860DRAFT_242361 [Xylaria cubensis]
MLSSSLQSIKQWQPFRVDALGLVTIFGAGEMNTAVGRLTESWVTDWLPYLGAYTVANNDIAKKYQGFALYNITDGIMTNDVCAWFTRWLITSPLTYAATTITLKFDGKPQSVRLRAASIGLGLLSTMPLLLMSGLIEDWWGVANAMSMIVSILIRKVITSQLRKSIDTAAHSSGNSGDPVKVFLTLPNGKAVTIFGPRMAIVSCLLTSPRPINSLLYLQVRALGWFAFGVHAITLGMASLTSQIMSVFVLLLSSALKSYYVGDRTYNIGKRLRLEVELGDAEWTRRSAYARLGLSPTEENYMVRWSLFPQRGNRFWWGRYRGTEVAFRHPKTSKSKGGVAVST